jgi:hypothetical protein
MATLWNSTNKPSSKTGSNHTFSGTMLSSWSRQQKIAMIAGFVILGLLLALSACSKQASKTALVGISDSGQGQGSNPSAPVTASTPAAPVNPVPAPVKKISKKRPAAIVSYRDPDSGISFRYPRRYRLASGDKSQPRLNGADPVAMNFVLPGGTPVATVAMPAASFPHSDFDSAFFHVNVNRSLSEQECSHFAFVDTRNADGEPIEAEKVKVGASDMEKTSDFNASIEQQAETEYYHRYENGACYEFVLGLGTAGYGAKDGVESVNRDEVFARLGKILASVRIEAVEQKQSATAQVVTGAESSK